MTAVTQAAKAKWESAFGASIQNQAYNTAPVEALVRNVSYYLRAHHGSGDLANLHFLEMGCGTGPNLRWLASKGIHVSGIDISPTAMEVCRESFAATGLEQQVGKLVEESVANTPFEHGTFNGVVEACVFQHLQRNDRHAAFKEIHRVLKPGGLFCGYMLSEHHTVFQANRKEELGDDPGTLVLESQSGEQFHLENLGVSHFFSKTELLSLLADFSQADVLHTTYELPAEEAARRGFDYYLQSMWTVYAIR